MLREDVLCDPSRPLAYVRPTCRTERGVLNTLTLAHRIYSTDPATPVVQPRSLRDGEPAGPRFPRLEQLSPTAARPRRQ